MKRIGIFILIGLIIVLTLILYSFYHGQNDTVKTTTTENYGSVARVKTVLIKKGSIEESIDVYGVSVPAAGALQTISVPFESKIKSVMVTDGEKVQKGELILEIGPSPNTTLQLEKTRSNYKSAKESLDHFKRLFDLKLATNDQLNQARNNFRVAKYDLQNMEGEGITSLRDIKASVPGLIKSVLVKEGDIVPPGSSFVEIVVQNQLQIRFGVEPEDLNKVHTGQKVSFTPVNKTGQSYVIGKIRKISNSLNSETNLVDVFVDIPGSDSIASEFLLGQFIVGHIDTVKNDVLIVPRNAVLPKDNGYEIFTIKDGKAHKHEVKTGVENKDEIEIEGNNVNAGDQVVVLGNYELEDGMRIDTGDSY